MKKRKLVITKENYKAYKELLYLHKNSLTALECAFICYVIIFSLIGIGISLAVAVPMAPGIIAKIFGGLGLIFLGEALAHVTIIPYVMKKLKFRDFKEENPTINSKIATYELEKTLDKITPHFSEASIEMCQKYYKAEEIKEEMLKERNYKSIRGDLLPTKEELEKARKNLRYKLDNVDTQIPYVSKTKKLTRF